MNKQCLFISGNRQGTVIVAEALESLQFSKKIQNFSKIQKKSKISKISKISKNSKKFQKFPNSLKMSIYFR
jgi:hypothetical protein